MFFRRKPLTLESLDARLSAVELALEIRRDTLLVQTPLRDSLGGSLHAALGRLGAAIARDEATRSR